MGLRAIKRDGRTISFEASYKYRGRKIRKRWKTKAAANQWLRDEEADKLISISLSGAQKIDAARALSILQPVGVSLEQAALKYIGPDPAIVHRAWTFRDACSAMLQARADVGDT